MAALLVHEHEILPIPFPRPFPLLAQRFDHKLRQFDIPSCSAYLGCNKGHPP
jgi:hypothetical protein